LRRLEPSGCLHPPWSRPHPSRRAPKRAPQDEGLASALGTRLAFAVFPRLRRRFFGWEPRQRHYDDGHWAAFGRRVAPHVFFRIPYSSRPLPRPESEPELSPILSGIAAYCHPTLRRDSASVTSCVELSGDAYVKRACGIRIGHFYRRSCHPLADDSFFWRRARGRHLPVGAEWRDSGRQALVLSDRTRHRAALLVSARRGRKAGWRGNISIGAGSDGDFAQGGNRRGALDRQCPCRIADACAR